MRNDVDRITRKNINAYRKNESEKMKQQAAGYKDRVNPDYAKAPAVAGNEENVLGMLLLYPEHKKKVFDEHLLTSNDFFTDLNRRIFEHIKSEYESNGSESVDINLAFSPEEVGRIAKMKISRMALSDNGPEVLLECIEALKKSMAQKSATSAQTYDALDKLINLMRKN